MLTRVFIRLNSTYWFKLKYIEPDT